MGCSLGGNWCEWRTMWTADQRIVDLSGPILEYVWLITQLAFWHMIRHWYVLPESCSMNFIPYQDPLLVSRIYTMDTFSWIYILTLQITGLGWIGWTWDPGATTRFLDPFLNKQLRPRVTQLPMLFPSSSRNQQQRFPRCSAPTETSLGPQRPTPGIGMLHKCKHGFSLGSTTIYYYNISSIMTCFVNLHTLDIRKDYTELSEYKAPLWLHGSYHPMHNPSGVGSGGTGWKLSTRPASNGPYTMENNMVNHLILGVLIFEHTRISTCHDMFFCSTSKEVHVDAVVAFFSFCYMFVRVSPSHTGSF